MPSARVVGQFDDIPRTSNTQRSRFKYGTSECLLPSRANFNAVWRRRKLFSRNRAQLSPCQRTSNFRRSSARFDGRSQRAGQRTLPGSRHSARTSLAISQSRVLAESFLQGAGISGVAIARENIITVCCSGADRKPNTVFPQYVNWRNGYTLAAAFELQCQIFA
jgi:hypothetical protein